MIESLLNIVNILCLIHVLSKCGHCKVDEDKLNKCSVIC